MTSPEMDFNVARVEDWEANVFRAAVQDGHFTIWSRAAGSRVITTFPEAVQIVQDDPRTLVYAVAKSGMVVCLARPQWPRYLEIWNTMVCDHCGILKTSGTMCETCGQDV